LSKLRQISTNFDNFWHKDGRQRYFEFTFFQPYVLKKFH